ncbi:metal ABC transporter solute-binding protein, Zn/Mn family [Pontibacillus salicampi]|uniref:Metal ABC transporter solute-binding protein, Zn/Mn family n=1 Tax=Pontibacillus salicampi TaxID=1449801 RepID=A0ABV6LPJ2_9BACI
MKVYHKGIAIIAIMILFVLAACSTDTSGSTEQSGEEDALHIYTTIYPIKDFAEKIGGDYVNVETILPAGADPHTYEPTSKTMVDIAKGDAFMYNSAHLEAYADKISESLKDEDVRILEASKGIDMLSNVHDHGEDNAEENHQEHESHEEEHAGESHEEEHSGHTEEGHSGESHEEEHSGHTEEGHSGESHEEEHSGHTEEGHSEESHEEEHSGHTEEEHSGESHEEEHSGHSDEEHSSESHEGHNHGDQDPHVWLDPIRAISIAENIKEELIALKPEQEETFQANFESLKQQLTELDQSFHDKLDDASQKKILVSHAAYGYWEQAYNLEQVAIAGLSPSQEPTQKQLESIIDISKQNEIEYVLFEQNVTPSVGEIIQEEIGAKPLRLHNISVLTEEDINNEEDYFSLMRHNLEVLEKVTNK